MASSIPNSSCVDFLPSIAYKAIKKDFLWKISTGYKKRISYKKREMKSHWLEPSIAIVIRNATIKEDMVP